jgi:Zn-dependent M28 family amino/carboxypeptidase
MIFVKSIPMKNKKITLLLAIFTTVSFAQVSPTKYIKSISKESLKTNLYIIASDEMEGRDTGSKGQKKAGEYLISQYVKAGITFPEGATDYYQKIPAASLNSRRNENLPDSENIWAFIKGSEKPEEVLVISAHYDHIGVKNGEINHGADDDGSGTVAVLEIAKAFQKAKDEGHGPKRSLLFLHVTGEEHGLLGSKYYSENPLFPIANTITDVNIDMIGRRDEIHKDSNDYVYIIGSDYLSSDLYTICEEANKNYIKTNLDYTFNDRNDPNRFYYRSDHYNFAKKGIPAVFLFNGVHADYHKPSDTADKIEFDALAKRAQLAIAIAWELANRDNRPVVDKPGN